GWNIISTSLEESILPETNQGKIKMIKLILQKGSQRQVVLYWFQSRGRFIASEYMQKIYLVIDSITRQRTDGSFVRLIAPIIGGSEEQTLKYMQNFVKTLIPILQEYIPS
ncbi:MAG: EpsI family protein, partial [Thermodesulfobacteriota bacterium]|nr:EpsI family protein [Thermodesulfobacteriota bacterium]